MINWNFNENDYEDKSFKPIPQGDHRVRILNAEELVSSNGNDMIKLTMDVSGYNSQLWYYLVFLKDNPKMVNQKLGQIFDSFGIKNKSMDSQTWIGKVGAARVKHEAYNGEMQTKVSYFLPKSKQEQLEPWKEADGVSSVTGDGMTLVTDEDLPF